MYLMDNDSLAGLLALELKADLLVLLSDVEGLYSGPPSDLKSKLIHTYVKEKHQGEITFGDKSRLGKGGMTVKVNVVVCAAYAGTPLADKLILEKISCPLGVLLVIFESQPDALVQVAAQALHAPEVISDILNGNLDHERTEFSLPPLMTLLLREPGTGGSSTPSMVGAVKKWQKSDPQKSLDTWRKLSEANSQLEIQLNFLSKLAKEQCDAYKSVINSCNKLRSEKWIEQASEPNKEAVIKALLGAKEAMLGIRYHMRLTGEAAGVPVSSFH
ncbi:phosphomevalonate kinase, peroxisomal-like [Arachis hypogaea]|uniref:phosphomevalonate kinase, peroxisomal-like n=1 Tax=Arachis hypogaea TaxID=3818 RepID=UPI003B21A510